MSNCSNEWLNKCAEKFLEDRLKRGLPSDTFKICVNEEWFNKKLEFISHKKDSNLKPNNNK